MTNEELADELITRLNAIIQDPQVRTDIGKLLETRVPCSQATLAHPTIQAIIKKEADQGVIGFLGVLNGLAGTVREGRFQGWGHIAAQLDDDGHLIGFCRTETTVISQA
jgi:hypothetical protein